MPIAKAVRASSAAPFVFEPVVWQGRVCVTVISITSICHAYLYTLVTNDIVLHVCCTGTGSEACSP